MRVLTLGETMALLDGVEGGLSLGAPFRLRVGGAESNFGIALTRLGVPVTWVSRLGTDAFGDLVLRTLASEGLDVSRVARDGERPTGVFFKWHERGESRVHYRRAGSAASALSAADVSGELFAGVDLVHLTGITTALSASAREAVLRAATLGREAGALVTLDPNWRPALWRSPADARDALADVLPLVDWFLCGEAEGRLLLDAAGVEQLRDAVLAAGAGAVSVRIGARGAAVWEDGRAVVVPPRRIEDVVDEIGAGDGFAAGFAYGLLHGFSPRACAHAGNLVAAAALRGTGDWETFPRLADIADELTADEQ